MLPQVSRTFALSIAMLPPTLRDAVGDAYLLCRIVDSIEDDTRLSQGQRVALFDAFDAVLGDDTIDEGVLERAAREAAVGETPAESELCARSGAVLRAFRALDRSQREAIRPHVLEMSRGMREYVTRAAREGRLRIADVADLERYCYFVAGTVGELLTDLFVLEVPGVDAQTLAELRRLAVPFGVGLQLVNIVKDVAADLERGACFLPVSLAEREGVALEDLLDPERRAEAMRVIDAVCDLAEEKLHDAQTYTLAWPAARANTVRLFCSVPLVLALASLRVVREGTSALVPDATPKVGRIEVFTIVRDAIAAIGDDRALADLFARYTRTNSMGASMQQPSTERSRDTNVRERTEQALARARAWLLARQSPTGYWKGELQTNVTMDAEDLLVRQFLGVRTEEQTRKAAVWIRAQQREDGTWANAYGAPADLSTTVESYVALRLAGDPIDAPHMRRAAEYIREHGGVPATRVFTRIWLALFGLWSWSALPVLPPEMNLLPSWVPLNVYDFACWARQTVVALTIVMTYKPVRPIPGLSLDELAPTHPATSRSPRRSRPISWRGRAFEGIDRVLRAYQKRPLSRLRELALGEAERWIVRRQEADGSWGGIQPPWVYSLMALSLRGYPMDHPVMRAGLEGLDRFTIHEGDARRLEACQSPVWDTAYVIQALADAGLQPSHDALVRGVDWLLSQEVRQKGDWAVRRPELAPSWWAFEFANVNYPDIDDTAEVVLALRRVLHPDPQRVESAVARSVRWMIGMRSKNGAWGAFDADNVRALCRDIPFCDFGEVIDEPSADVTAHVIEALAKEGLDEHPAIRRGVDWLLKAQEADGSWFGRWGVNYVYGTGASLMALAECGVEPGSPAIRRAVAWLESHQNRDGGWGEDVRSYDDPKWAGVGDSTASQTAWAVLGLIAAGERGRAALRGISWLIDAQKADGRWDEPQFTGTGFPGDFYINYHLYRQVFPMMALGRYAAAMDGKPVGVLPLRDHSLVQLRTREMS